MEKGQASESSSSSSDGSNEIQQNQPKPDKAPISGPSLQRANTFGNSSSSHGTQITISDTMRQLASCRSNYNLAIPNQLPLEFHSESSSRLQLPQVQPFYPQTMALAGSSSRNSVGTPIDQSQRTNWRPQSPLGMPSPALALGSQDQNFQGLLNQAMVGSSTSYFPSSGVPCQVPPPNMPTQQGIGSFQMANPLNPYQMAEGFPSNTNKAGNWVPQVDQGNLEGINYAAAVAAETSNARAHMYPRNSVYDPMFEALGLPVDPHLRLFVGRRTTGSP